MSLACLLGDKQPIGDPPGKTQRGPGKYVDQAAGSSTEEVGDACQDQHSEGYGGKSPYIPCSPSSVWIPTGMPVELCLMIITP